MRLAQQASIIPEPTIQKKRNKCTMNTTQALPKIPPLEILRKMRGFSMFETFSILSQLWVEAILMSISPMDFATEAGSENLIGLLLTVIEALSIRHSVIFSRMKIS